MAINTNVASGAINGGGKTKENPSVNNKIKNTAVSGWEVAAGISKPNQNENYETEIVDIDYNFEPDGAVYESKYTQDDMENKINNTFSNVNFDGKYIYAYVTDENGNTQQITVPVSDLNGMIISQEQVPFDQISSNVNNAINGIYVNVTEDDKQWWGNNGNLTINVRNDGTVEILEGEIIMGFTTIESILNSTNYNPNTNLPSIADVALNDIPNGGYIKALNDNDEIVYCTKYGNFENVYINKDGLTFGISDAGNVIILSEDGSVNPIGRLSDEYGDFINTNNGNYFLTSSGNLITGYGNFKASEILTNDNGEKYVIKDNGNVIVFSEDGTTEIIGFKSDKISNYPNAKKIDTSDEIKDTSDISDDANIEHDASWWEKYYGTKDYSTNIDSDISDDANIEHDASWWEKYYGTKDYSTNIDSDISDDINIEHDASWWEKYYGTKDYSTNIDSNNSGNIKTDFGEGNTGANNSGEIIENKGPFVDLNVGESMKIGEMTANKISEDCTAIYSPNNELVSIDINGKNYRYDASSSTPFSITTADGNTISYNADGTFNRLINNNGVFISNGANGLNNLGNTLPSNEILSLCKDINLPEYSTTLQQ